MITSAIALPPMSVRLRLAMAPEVWPIYRLLLIAAATITVLAAAEGFAVERHDLPIVLAAIATGIATAAALRGAGWRRSAAALEGMLLAFPCGMAAIFLTMVLAPAGPAYADPWLAAVDRWLVPFTWPDMVVAIRDHPRPMAIMEAVYRSLSWQPFLLIVVLAITGREAAGYRFIHAWLLALIASVAIFAIVPAMTPYVYYGFTPAEVPTLTVDAGWTPHRVLESLRDGSARTLSIQAMAGLITFPSFHAAGAVLLGWGFRRVPFMGMPFAAWNGAMLLTIPMIGSHYFIDVVAGVGIAALAIRGSRQ